MHDEMLRLARVLATVAGGSPRWVARNRAVSTAYYALFHALAGLCGRELVGASKPGAAFRHIYRSLDHGQARRFCDLARRDGGFSDRLKFAAALFVELQALRHLADYDPGFRITRKDLDVLLANIELAFDHLQQLSREESKLLAANLIGRRRA